MHWITENPSWMIGLGIVVEALLVVALVRTGRAVLLAGMGLVAAFVLAGLLAERAIVTPREEVENALDGAAAALVANDLPGVLRFLAPDAAQLRGEAEANMPQLHFSEAKIRDLQIAINRYVTPPTAVAQFLGVISVEDARGELPHEHYLEHFTVNLRRDGDRWLLTGVDRQPRDESGPSQRQAAQRR